MLIREIIMPKTNNALLYFAIASVLSVSLVISFRGGWLRLQLNENTYMQIGEESLNTQ